MVAPKGESYQREELSSSLQPLALSLRSESVRPQHPWARDLLLGVKASRRQTLDFLCLNDGFNLEWNFTPVDQYHESFLA